MEVIARLAGFNSGLLNVRFNSIIGIAERKPMEGNRPVKIEELTSIKSQPTKE